MVVARVVGPFCRVDSALPGRSLACLSTVASRRMPPKKATAEAPKPLLGRPSNNLKMGVVGLPNVGYTSRTPLRTLMTLMAA